MFHLNAKLEYDLCSTVEPMLRTPISLANNASGWYRMKEQLKKFGRPETIEVYTVL